MTPRPPFMATAVLLATLAAALLPAAAQQAAPEQPLLRPGKDVVIGYNLSPGAGEAIAVRVSMAAGGTALRMDLPDQTYMVALPTEKKLTLVVPLERTALELPWSDGPQALFLPDERGRYARKGEATVAGQRCTNWEVAVDRARSTLCLTADGVLLRSQGQDASGRRNLIEAFGIRFQALVESDFAVPEDFERLVGVPKAGR